MALNRTWSYDVRWAIGYGRRAPILQWVDQAVIVLFGRNGAVMLLLERVG